MRLAAFGKADYSPRILPTSPLRQVIGLGFSCKNEPHATDLSCVRHSLDVLQYFTGFELSFEFTGTGTSEAFFYSNRRK